jgi:competence protein ComEC
MRQRWLAALLVLLTAAPASAEMTVHFVDVGQGGGVFVEKDGKHIIYDCGDTFAADTFTGYLEALDVTVIDAMVISHAHKDHMGSCAAVIKKFTVKRVYHNGSKAPTAVWKAFLTAVKKADEVIVVDKNLDAGAFDILVAYNSRDRFSKEADNSLVVRLVDGTVRVLLTGDCEAACERALMSDNSAGMKAAVLNIGHHGSNAASSLPFLKLVAPETAVISAGAGNQYGHPTKPVLQRLGQVKAKVFRTDQDGSVVIHSDGLKYKVETDK